MDISDGVTRSVKLSIRSEEFLGPASRKKVSPSLVFPVSSLDLRVPFRGAPLINGLSLSTICPSTDASLIHVCLSY